MENYSSKTDQETVTNFYETEAEKYDRKRWATEIGEFIRLVQRDIVLGMIPSWEGKKTLEVGIGTGRFTAEISKQGAFVTGLDISRSMIKKAREKVVFEGLDGRVKFVIGNVTSLPFRNGQFDGCILINVLSHLPAWECAIKEISRVLKPGAFLIGNFNNLLSCYFIAGIIINLRKKSLYYDVYTRWLGFAQLRRICFKLSLKVEGIKGQLFFPPRYFASNVQGLAVSCLRRLDSKFRCSALKNIAPIIFFKATKI